MDKFTSLAIASVLIALLLGSTFTYAFLPRKVYVDVPGKDVIKEVPVNVTKIVEVDVDKNAEFADKAKVQLIKYLDKNDLLVCNGETYDKDQVLFSKIDKIAIDTSDEDETIVSLDARLKFLDKDTNVKCYQDVSSEVTFYTDGDKPTVEIL